MSLDFAVLLDLHCRLAESPVYDARQDALFFVDILSRRLYRLDLRAGALEHWDCDSEVGSIGLCDTSGRLVMAQRAAVGLFDLAAGRFAPLAEIEADLPHTRLNDGKVGPDGAFWVGSIDERSPRQPVASLYRVDPRGRVERKVDGLRASNGLAWSPDGRIIYHSDSDPAARWIDAWDFDPETGSMTARRRLAQFSVETGYPDGGAIDVEGCYWSGGVSAGRVNRLSPDGRLIEWHAVPAAAPTMPCFGGQDLETLFVTSLTEGLTPAALERLPHSGGVFSAAAPVAGTPVARFPA